MTSSNTSTPACSDRTLETGRALSLAPSGHMQLGAADGNPSWRHMGLVWGSPSCQWGPKVLGKPFGRDSAQGPEPMDVQCEWLCWGGGSPSPHCCALPYSLGTLILHLNVSPYLSPSPSQEQLPTPLHPQQLPKCLSPMSLPQRAGPMALFPAGNQSPEHVSPVPPCPQEQLPGSASQNLPPQKILLP